MPLITVMPGTLNIPTDPSQCAAAFPQGLDTLPEWPAKDLCIQYACLCLILHIGFAIWPLNKLTRNIHVYKDSFPSMPPTHQHWNVLHPLHFGGSSAWGAPPQPSTSQRRHTWECKIGQEYTSVLGKPCLYVFLLLPFISMTFAYNKCTVDCVPFCFP